jgi:hypothetical protein
MLAESKTSVTFVADFTETPRFLSYPPQMKKVLTTVSFVLAAVATLSLASCGGEKAAEATTNATEMPAEAPADTTAAAAPAADTTAAAAPAADTTAAAPAAAAGEAKMEAAAPAAH